MESDFDLVEPNPSALIESLRAFGYSPETAVADLIDNSITARATLIQVGFDWCGDRSLVYVLDNGRGMDEATLVNAMRAGSRSPLETRDSRDLGRFGLGLKTASFSQCRILTVASSTDGANLALRSWNLDEVQMTGEWRLLRTASGAALEVIKKLRQSSGTLVIWEQLDRLVGAALPDDQASEKSFYDVADRVESHISMTFHRFIGRGLDIRIGNNRVRKWDPFLERIEVGAQSLGTEKIPLNGSIVRVEAFVLPHRSKLSQMDYELAGGKRGWNDLQGFYVYRNNRLLVAGDWLGLRLTKEEHYKLARIRVDIDNAMDDLWQIDVKKSVAVPPHEIRNELKRIASYTRQRAAEVYRHRGKVVSTMADYGITSVWSQIVKHGRISYRINQSHPAVSNALEEPTVRNIRTLLHLVEETIPIPLISISSSENPESHTSPLESATPRQVAALAIEVLQGYKKRGATHEAATLRVLTTEPFNMYPELIEVLGKAASSDHDQ